MKAKLVKKQGKMHLKLKKGALHEALGIKADKNIPASKETIKDTDSPLMKKRKQFALNASKWNKK